MRIGRQAFATLEKAGYFFRAGYFYINSKDAINRMYEVQKMHYCDAFSCGRTQRLIL